MSKDCKDSCVKPWQFPKELYNRPGLSTIDYCIGNYYSFREILLGSIKKYPALAGWSYRGSDDPGIALLECSSILCDILAFYQNLYANETKLRTSKWRQSVSDLVRLVGYRLSPGTGGIATFAFEAMGDKPLTIPKGFQLKATLEGFSQPIEFETSKDTVVYPQLSKFNLFLPLNNYKIKKDSREFYYRVDPEFATNSEPGSFELEKGDKLLIGYSVIDKYKKNIKPSEKIDALFTDAEIVIVEEVRKFHGYRIFTVKERLTKLRYHWDKVVAYRIGDTFRHFGHNAPPKMMEIISDTAKETKITHLRPPDGYKDEDILERKVDNNLIWEKIAIQPSLQETDLPLDNEVNGIQIGRKIAIQTTLFSNISSYRNLSKFLRHYPFPKNPSFKENENIKSDNTFIRTIQNIRQSTMTWGSITGSTSVVSLDADLSFAAGSVRYNSMDIRTIQIHEITSPLLELSSKQEDIKPSDANSLQLNFYGAPALAQILLNRQLFLVSPSFEPILSKILMVSLDTDLDNMPSDDLKRFNVTLSPVPQNAEKAFANEKPECLVYGNLVEATQGKTYEDVVLGNGDFRQDFQTFSLPKEPLTYFLDEKHSLETPVIQVYVNDEMWTFVPSLFGRKITDKVYIIRQDSNGYSWIQFGDGKTGGSRLPTGIGNVVARFRIGLGAYGNLKNDTNVQLSNKLKSLDKVNLFDTVSGGENPEGVDSAKVAAPGRVQSLERLVSIKDFESEAMSIAGVSKASAKWDIDSNGIPSINIRILMQHGRDKEFDNIKQVLKNSDKLKGMQRHPIKISQSNFQQVDLNIEYGYDFTLKKSNIEKLIMQKLGVIENKDDDGSQEGLFGSKRKIGEHEYISRIDGLIQNIPGVIWVRTISNSSSLDSNTLHKDLILCSSDNVLALEVNCLKMTGHPVQ